MNSKYKKFLEIIKKENPGVQKNQIKVFEEPTTQEKLIHIKL